MEEISSSFASAQEHIDWANRAAKQLETEIAEFFQANPARMVLKFDLRTGENVIFLQVERTVPSEIRRKATEALQNARHSFDQSLFAARSILEGKPPSNNFPWAETPGDLEARMRRWDIHDVLREVLRSHEPYDTSENHLGGHHLIRTLAKIANNKHTVGLGLNSKIGGSSVSKAFVTKAESFTMTVAQWVDAKTGEVELLRWRGDRYLGRNCKAIVEICFRDPRLTKSVEISKGIRLFNRKAQAVLDDLWAVCRGKN